MPKEEQKRKSSELRKKKLAAINADPEKRAAYRANKKKDHDKWWEKLNADPVRLALYHERKKQSAKKAKAKRAERKKNTSANSWRESSIRMVKDGECVDDGDDCKAGANNNCGRSDHLETENVDGDGIIHAVARRADDEGNFQGHNPMRDTGTVDNDDEDDELKVPTRPEVVKTPLIPQSQHSHTPESAQAEVYHDHVAVKQEIEAENGVVIGDITFTSHKASEINSNLQPAIFYQQLPAAVSPALHNQVGLQTDFSQYPLRRWGSLAGMADQVRLSPQRVPIQGEYLTPRHTGYLVSTEQQPYLTLQAREKQPECEGQGQRDLSTHDGGFAGVLGLHKSVSLSDTDTFKSAIFPALDQSVAESQSHTTLQTAHYSPLTSQAPIRGNQAAADYCYACYRPF